MLPLLPGVFTNHQIKRVKGFEDAVKSEKGIHIIDVQESDISRVRAAEKTYQILQDHPEVNAFFGTSALDGIGIAQEVEKYKKNDHIYIFAFDTLPETLEYIRKGTINATVVQEPFQMGYEAVKIMINQIEGKPIPPIVHTDTRIMRVQDLPIGQQARMGGSR
jgi:ribose transport system substrate-binding protein